MKQNTSNEKLRAVFQFEEGERQGYAKAIDDVLRIFDLCKGMTVEELKSSIAKLKEMK